MPLDKQAQGAVFLWLVVVPILAAILLGIVLLIFRLKGWL